MAHWIDDVIAQPQPPGDVTSPMGAIKCRQIVGVSLKLDQAGEEAFGDENLAVAADHRRNIMQAIFGMILDAPENTFTKANFRRLDGAQGVVSRHDRALRKSRHHVAMDRRRIVDGSAIPVHRMGTTGFRQRNLARKCDLSPLWIEFDLSSRSDGGKLKAPTRAEHRDSPGKKLAHEIDLPQRLGVAIVNIQRRPGDRDAVVRIKRLRPRPRLPACRYPPSRPRRSPATLPHSLPQASLPPFRQFDAGQPAYFPLPQAAAASAR